MHNSRQRGATFALVLTTIFTLMIFGSFFYMFAKFIGGARELKNATDAGGLNLAKQALKHPNIQLQGAELQAFEGVSNAGSVDLLSYNRIVGQSFLVAMNAEAEGTDLAHQHARALNDMVDGGDQSIGGRLRSSLSNSGNVAEHFLKIAQANTVRMLSLTDKARYNDDDGQVAYLKPGVATNVDFNPEVIPYMGASNSRLPLPANALSDKQSARKFPYLAGYAPIYLPGVNRYVTGVPLRPGNKPHLVSKTDFQAGLNPVVNAGTVPPNGFRVGGLAQDGRALSCAIVGSLTADFPASIPHGYIVISNGAPTSFSGVLGDSNQIFAKELMTGIYVGPGGGSNRAFTTDGALYQQWLNYNKAVASGQTPLPKKPSTNGIYGDPTSITKAPELITWTDYANPNQTATNMLSAFQTTYGAKYPPPSNNFSSDQLMAVENIKAQVIEGFGRVTRVHDPSDPAFTCHVTAPGRTGLKYVNPYQSYAAPPGPVAFGVTGTLAQLFPQCQAGSIKKQVTQRLFQIKPNATDDEIQAVLKTASLPMGAKLYIYMNAQGILQCTPKAPSWYAGEAADGQIQACKMTYQPNGITVDVPGDGGAPVFPFDRYSTLYASDTCTYVPSSGYNNLLGVVNFYQEASFDGPPGGGGSSSGTYSDPN